MSNNSSRRPGRASPACGMITEASLTEYIHWPLLTSFIGGRKEKVLTHFRLSNWRLQIGMPYSRVQSCLYKGLHTQTDYCFSSCPLVYLAVCSLVSSFGMHRKQSCPIQLTHRLNSTSMKMATMPTTGNQARHSLQSDAIRCNQMQNWQLTIRANGGKDKTAT